MKPADLSKQPSHWLSHTGPDCEIVVSSRVRLARNLAGFEFSRTVEGIQDSLLHGRGMPVFS